MKSQLLNPTRLDFDPSFTLDYERDKSFYLRLYDDAGQMRRAVSDGLLCELIEFV